MKKITLFAVSGIVMVLALSTNSGKAGKTGSPGESTCFACHSDFPLNSGPGTIAITSNIPGGGWTAGSTYTINVTLSQAAMPLFGFDFEALNSANTNAGTLVVTNAAETHIMTSSGKNNMTHVLDAGLTTGSHTFTFDWVAPATGSGMVTFYTAGICADNSTDEFGDYVHSTSLQVGENTLGIVENTNKADINIYPVPVSRTLNIDASSMNGTSVVNVINSLGQVVYSSEYPAGKFEIDMSDFANGVYIMQLKNDNHVITKKFVKE